MHDTAENESALRYVAFIDILGFSALVARSELEPDLHRQLLRVLGVVAAEHTYRGPIRLGASDPERESVPSRLRGNAFSDNIVLSIRRDSGSGLVRILHKARELCFRLLNLGVMPRGGMVVGRLFQNESIVLGTGLVHAYRLESEVAVYPRIVVSDEVVSDYRAVRDSPWLFSAGEPVFRADFDGLWHLDYLSADPSSFSTTGEPLTREAWLLGVRQLVQGNLARPMTLRVRAKYGWFCRYFNQVIAEQEINVPPLPDTPEAATHDGSG